MSDIHSNPYEPEGYNPADASMKPRGRMEYMQSVNYIFQNPNWLQNVLFTALCFFIPVVGPLVIYGYQFEIIETLHLRRGASYPDFNFDRFVDYLVRGLWVFLVAFVLSLATIPISLAIMFLGFLVVGGLGAAGGDEAAAIGMMVVMPVFFLLVIGLSILIHMFMVPFILRAGLTQDFGASFDFAFAKQFVGNTWGSMIVTALFLMVAVPILEILGLAMVCVGIFFTLAIAQLLVAHLGFQLYEVHLARGGDPIPIQPPKST